MKHGASYLLCYSMDLDIALREGENCNSSDSNLYGKIQYVVIFPAIKIICHISEADIVMGSCMKSTVHF